MEDLIWVISVSLTFSVVLGWGARLGFRAPDKKSPSSPLLQSVVPYHPITPGHFVSSNDQGAFGEALTLMMLAAEGWRPHNGKPGPGSQGIDGIFVRDGENQWQALLVETKTNVSRYRSRQMETDKLCRTLDALYVACGDEALRALYGALVKGLQEDAGWIQKALWRHHLARGVTEVTRLDRSGDAVGAIQTRQSAGFMEALAISLSELDRQNVYWSGRR